jgi:hypothetical protein
MPLGRTAWDLAVNSDKPVDRLRRKRVQTCLDLAVHFIDRFGTLPGNQAIDTTAQGAATDGN